MLVLGPTLRGRLVLMASPFFDTHTDGFTLVEHSQSALTLAPFCRTIWVDILFSSLWQTLRFHVPLLHLFYPYGLYFGELYEFFFFFQL